MFVIIHNSCTIDLQFTSEYQSYVTNSALVWSRLLASQVSSAASAARNVLFEVLESLQAARRRTFHSNFYFYSCCDWTNYSLVSM